MIAQTSQRDGAILLQVAFLVEVMQCREVLRLSGTDNFAIPPVTIVVDVKAVPAGRRGMNAGWKLKG